MNRIALSAASLLIALPLCAPVFAQTSAPPNTGTAFKDTSMLKPPAGERVAIFEFEDLECPACAHAFPITRAAAEHYKIPLLHHDFPLKMHIWSLDAAITARYMQDKVSPQAAEDYRRAVFANQNSIASKEDLQNFTRHYFQTHGHEMPFVVDPTGQFAREVQADYQLGERVGLTQTPTIFVVTPKHWVQITDVNDLYQTIDTALAETPAVASSKMRHPAKAQQR
ncbi:MULTISPECIES: thioredoxin domain-containing protein [Acidobacteriaceae]|uniref:DsbA family protein n=1 Tax=Acidobacteriaceae TaxID=204434 RepID=UPI00131D13C6|nr:MULTISPECIES: thioredoxin domain-containing protein [Acidobacteriaceae]MDW5266334.1 thioredoxin domain-containing protein [Edaphobacter sp.]